MAAKQPGYGEDNRIAVYIQLGKELFEYALVYCGNENRKLFFGYHWQGTLL